MLITFHKYALFVGMIAIAVMHYFYTDPITTLPSHKHSSNNSALTCALSTTPCHQAGATLTLNKDVIRPMEKARIDIKWPTLPDDIEQLALSLEGEEMMMGIYRIQLTRETGTSHFTGELMLPFCTSSAMTWVGNAHPILDAPQASQDRQYHPLSLSIRMIK